MLIAGDSRVNAPINFDAVLNARLAEMRSRSSFWGLGSMTFLRLGAATAGLIIMIFAAQYTGLFSNNANPPKNPEVARAVPFVKDTPVDPTPEAVNPTPPAALVAGGGFKHGQHLAFDKDNKILGLRVKTHANLGAYMSLFSSAVPTWRMRPSSIMR